MAEADDRIRMLEERVERLEKQVALLLKRTASGGARPRGQEMRDRYDALDYPER